MSGDFRVSEMNQLNFRVVSGDIDIIKPPIPPRQPQQKVELNQVRMNTLLIEDHVYQSVVQVFKAKQERLGMSGANPHEVYMQTLKVKQIESEHRQIQNLRDVGDGSAYKKASTSIVSKWQKIPDYIRGGNNLAYLDALKNLDIRNFARTVIAEHKPHYDADIPAVGITKEVILERLERYKAQRPAIDQHAPNHGWFPDKGYVNATFSTIKSK